MPYTSRVADRVTADIARWAQARQLAPIAVATFSLGFGIIAAAWFTESSAQGQVIGCAFLVASVSTAHVARAMTGPRVTVATEWGRAACVLLAELTIYAGLAASGGQALDGLTGPFGPTLRSTVVDRAGGHAAAGGWLLAVLAAVVLALLHMAELCGAGPSVRLPRLGAVRLLLAGLALLLAGPRACSGCCMPWSGGAAPGTGAMLTRQARQSLPATGVTGRCRPGSAASSRGGCRR